MVFISFTRRKSDFLLGNGKAEILKINNTGLIGKMMKLLNVGAKKGGTAARRAAGLIISICFVMLLPAKKIADLESITRPEKIVIAKNVLYVLEEAHVYIFSLEDYRLIKKIGKRGQGPGELSPLPNYKLQMEEDDGDILLNSKSKIVFFTGAGEFIREKRIPFTALQVIPINENYAISKSVSNENGMNSIGLVFFDSEFKQIRIAYSRQFPHYLKSGRIDMIPHLILIRKYDNKIFSFDQKGDFEINIYDTSGHQLRKIKTDYKKQKVPGKYIEKTWEWARKDIRLRSVSEEIRKMAYFPTYFPVMKNFLIDDDKIYIHTYEMNFEENTSAFIIIDFKGKILKKIFLHGVDINTIEFSPYTFKKGQYIYLFENPENEKIELHMENIH